MAKFLEKVMRIAAVLAISAPAFAGVTVSSPANGSTVNSPSHFIASASASRPIHYMHIYVDGRNVYGGATSKIDRYVSMRAGHHSVIIRAWDSKGVTYQHALSVNVSSGSAPGGSAAVKNGSSTSNLDQAGGWSSCDACSGIHQQGPKTARSVTHVSTPSLDGHSMQLWIGGTHRYGSALFWKSLGTTKTRHFKTDLFFYIKNSAASQALEFDIYQNLGGKHTVLGAECSLKTSRRWSVYDTKFAHWRPTSAPCNYLAPFKWHHLVTEQESTADGHSHMIAITLDGKKYYINKYYGVKGGSGSGSTIGLQLDGNSKMTSYAVWYDKVSVTRY
jgi:hypothetical protein